MSKNKLDFNGLETLITMIKNYVTKLFLPLTGGTMNGNISWNKGEIGYKSTDHGGENVCKQIILTAGSLDEEWSSPNAKIALHIYDSENSAEDGGFILQSSNGNNYPTLWGKPNGTLTWDNVNLVQPGIIQAYAGTGTPTGWLLCDGSAVSRTTYSKLFSIISTKYGAGDGSTTFNLPNLTNKFIEGNATPGTSYGAGLPNITGEAYLQPTQSGNETVPSAIGAFSTQGEIIRQNYPGNGDLNITISSTKPYYTDNINLNASRSSSIYGASSTVQPPALTLRYIIKY